MPSRGTLEAGNRMMIILERERERDLYKDHARELSLLLNALIINEHIFILSLVHIKIVYL